MPARARWTLLAAMALGVSTPAAAAAEKLLAAARTAQPAVIESLREMVLIESGSQDAAGLRAAGWKDYAGLTVLISPEEEIGFNGSGETIATLGHAHDVVRSFEPTAAKAVARHAGAAPGQGRHVRVELPRQLLQTQDVAKGMALAIKAQAIHAGLDGRQLLLHPSSGGGSDDGDASRSGKAALLDSLGLAGWGHHAKNEYIEIDSVSPRLYLTTPLPGDLGAGR